ncbi:alpha-2-macroglobulin family protein [Thalassococcus sp. BH17M4-6]|uniref:alpha-2-macroglobulin family protein n=1 Tax=Thalassococcus sp. BH17M4-6 TaxID=3413148 RepID=UPI003BC0A3A5
MRRLLSALLLVLIWAHPAAAQDPVPDRRLVVTRDVDFYGADLQSLFETTLEACQNVCLNNAACQAFTFNQRSRACFPKSTVSDRQPYEGAISAQVFVTDPETLSRAPARAAELGFLRRGDLNAARAEAEALAARHGGGQWTVDQLLQAAREQEQAGNLRSAVQWTGAALAQTDAPDQWMEYARLSAAFAETLNGSEQRRFRDRARLAAINGYLRAGPAPVRISALVELARALESARRGPEMIPALRLAESLGSRADVTALLDNAIGKYGFRIVEHTVESDSATPRICAEFSDPLVRAGVDYSPFVRLPDPRLAVQSDDRRICVEGVSHGSRYQITFRAGLPAASGEEMVKDVTLNLYVRDRSPAVSFPGRSYVLPKTADAGIPVQSVNLDTLDLTLRRVSDRNLLRSMQDDYFGRPLSQYQQSRFSSEIAEEVWTGQGTVENRLNADVLTRLPLGEVISDLPAGVYTLTAAVPGADPYDDPGATQWFILTDIGLTTLQGTDGLHVFARGLSDARTLEGLTVTLVSQANRVLGTARTDADGVARFGAGLTRGTGGAAPALVTVADAERDYAFLSLTDPAFDLSDRGVAGREPSPAIDAFLATDRGAYRAGEVIHATALMRDAQAAAVTDLPVTAVLSRPDGVEHSRTLSTSGQAGGHVFDLPLAPSVPRGTWRLAVYADPDAAPLADRTLLVEDFVPEKIDFDLTLPEGPIRPQSPPLLEVAARYLFGAPGADLPIEGEVRLVPRRTLDAFPGYRFGRFDDEVDTRTNGLTGERRTDADGRAQIDLPLPASDLTGTPFEMTATLRLSEGSGRPIERSITRPVVPTGPMIGIKPLFDGVVAENTEAAFELIALGPDLAPAPMQVTWTLNRITTRYQWYQLYGNWDWEPVSTRSRVAGGTAALGGDPVQIAAPVEWGRYELVVERAEGDYVASSVDLYAGWYAPADASATPDTLELSLDAEAYAPGDTATLRVVPHYAGKALVTVLANRVIAMQAVEVTEGENHIPLEVTDEWGAGAYVTAQVIRPMNVAAGQNPARSLGLAHAAIDPGDKQLTVSLMAPDTSQPRGPLEAMLRVDGLAEGDTGYATVAAVDLGILNLTGFDSPDPSAHYFGQRRLGVEIRDVYGRLIDGMNGAMGQIRSGGDAGAVMRLQSPPPTEKLVAFFSGPVTIGADGTATVRFDIPEFNGTVRLMAVAWSDTGVGQAEADVLVRDPVVVSASLPRFLAPGDTSRLLLEIVHASGPSGQMGLEVSAEGLRVGTASLPGTFDLGEGATYRISLPVAADDVGDHSLQIALITPDGTRLEKTLTLGVRANDPAISVTRRFALSPGQTFTLDAEVFDGLRTDTATALLSAGPLARFDAPGLLASLDRYPYGCTEQVTSQAMPLLYLSSVAEAIGLGETERMATRIDQAITRILTRQAANGAFGLWRADSGDFWLDAYVTDFLSRARTAGHPVPDLAFDTAMDNLRNRISYAADFDDGGEDIAYALMVLAREGQAAMGDLRYYVDTKADDFGTPLAMAQMGAALAQYGDQTRADLMFAKAAARMSGQLRDEAPVWRADYGTSLRDAAGLLSLAVESGSGVVDGSVLTARIASADRPLSTQEQSWALLAAHAMVQDPTVSGLSVDGAPVSGPFVRRLAGDALIPQAITNTSSSPADITLTTLGVPEVPAPPGGYGYAIKREYFTMEGDPVSDTIRQGDRLVTVLTVRPAEETGARLMIDDPLPAGFEIDNPNLLRAGDIRALDWLRTADADYSEFRSDRFLTAVDWRGTEPLRLAYVVRAVSPGTFHHPAALVEDMYRPQYRARTDTSRITIQP